MSKARALCAAAVILGLVGVLPAFVSAECPEMNVTAAIRATLAGANVATGTIVDPSYLAVAQAGWAGLQAKILVDPTGQPVITDAVVGMGARVDYAAYVNKLHYANSTHGLATILLAAVAMEHY